MKKENLKSYLMTGLLILVMFLLIIGIICLVLREVAPDIFHLLRTGNQQEMEDYIRSAGSMGMGIIFLLQFLQVLSIVLMGLPIQLSAGVICGALKGYLICELGFLLGNLFVFLIARRMKQTRVVQLLQSRSNMKLITQTKYPVFIIIIAGMMPGVPNGIIPYAAAGTNISTREFAGAIFAGSSVGILISCTVGAHLLAGNYLVAGLLFLLQFILIFLLYKNRTRLINWYTTIKEKHQSK